MYRLHVPANPKLRVGDERLIDLAVMHGHIERILVLAAESVGLDGPSIAFSSSQCRSALDQNPKLGDCGNWPTCLNRVRKIEGPRESVEKINKASDELIRLEARIALHCWPPGVGKSPCKSGPTLRQSEILEAVGDKTLQGKAIAIAAGFKPNAGFRGDLSNMVKLGLLIKVAGEGYKRHDAAPATIT